MMKADPRTWTDVLTVIRAMEELRHQLVLDDLTPPSPETIRVCEALAAAVAERSVPPPDHVSPWDADEVDLRWCVPGGYVIAEVAPGGQIEVGRWSRSGPSRQWYLPATEVEEVARILHGLFLEADDD